MTKRLHLRVGLASVMALGLVASLTMSACGDDSDKKRPRQCEPEKAECLGNQGGQVCPADGLGFVAFSCDDGETCEDGECLADCAPAASECVSTSLSRTCADDGKAWVPEACDVGQACDMESGRCIVGEGGPTVCDPETPTQCATTHAEKSCDADGSSWVITPCLPGFSCNANEDGEGHCELDGATCAPGEGVCVDGNAVICTPDGSGTTEVECTDAAPCIDGKCQGPVCNLGESRCQEITADALLSGTFEFNLKFECVDGTSWQRTYCDEGQLCIYDGVDPVTARIYREELMAWFQDQYYGGGENPLQSLPKINIPFTTASCVDPECTNPYYFGSFFEGDFGFPQTGSMACGDPSDNDVDPLTAFSVCDGFPPVSNLFWAPTECGEGETCYSNGPSNAYCYSECRDGETICAAEYYGSDYYEQDGKYTCVDGYWQYNAEVCPTDDTMGVAQDCVTTSTVDGYRKATCMNPICAWWYEEYNDYYNGGPDVDFDVIRQDFPQFGACFDGQVISCDDEGQLDLENPEDCDLGICTETYLGDYYWWDGYYAGSCGYTECEDGEVTCAGGNPYAMVDCVNGQWSNVPTLCDAADGYCYNWSQNGYYGAVCGGECVPNSDSCDIGDNTLIVHCDEDGKLEAPAPCEFGACKSGGITGAYCEGNCVPDQAACSAATDARYESICNNNGLYEPQTQCDLATSCRFTGYNGNIYQQTGCVECVGPDFKGGNYAWGITDQRCSEDGLSVETCGDGNDYASGDSTDCPADYHCVDSSYYYYGHVYYSQAAYCVPDGN